MTRDARSVTPPETSAASRAQAMRRARGGGAPWERFGWVMAIVWLVFLIYPLITLINSPADFGWRLACKRRKAGAEECIQLRAAVVSDLIAADERGEGGCEPE